MLADKSPGRCSRAAQRGKKKCAFWDPKWENILADYVFGYRLVFCFLLTWDPSAMRSQARTTIVFDLGSIPRVIHLPDALAEFYRLADLLRMMAATARTIERRLDGEDAEQVRRISAEIDALATKVGETAFVSAGHFQAAE